MTPERMEQILAGVQRSLRAISDELEDLQTTCPHPQVRHLRQSVEQMRVSLEQIIERSRSA